MKGYFKNVSPTGAIGDLWEQLRKPQKHRWRFIALSAAMTASIFLLFSGQEESGLPKPLKVIYFPSFAPDRTNAQIIAGNIAATKKLREQEAKEAAQQEEIRQRYKAVGDYFGMDTDKFYREGEKERAAAKKALDERNAEILKNNLKRGETGSISDN